MKYEDISGHASDRERRSQVTTSKEEKIPDASYTSSCIGVRIDKSSCFLNDIEQILNIPKHWGAALPPNLASK